jgi:hypothetical protein
MGLLLYDMYVFFNNDFNHPKGKKEKRENELESEKMLNILFFFLIWKHNC